MRESIEMTGRVRILLTDQQGLLVHDSTHDNRIVKGGRQLVAQLFGGVPSGAPPTKVTHMGVGTGAADVTDDQTDLASPRNPRNPITSVSYTEIVEAGPQGPVKRVKASLQAVFEPDQVNGDVPLREAGMFTAPSAGVMYNRVTFPAVTKSNNFRLTLIWDVVF